MDRISRRQAVRGAGAAAAMMLGSPSVHAQNGQQTLRFVAQADLKILDPIWTTAYITRNHGSKPFGRGGPVRASTGESASSAHDI